MLPKAHLTSQSRISGVRAVTTALWLSWLLRLFLYNSSVYSCYLFFISSGSIRSYHFCPLWCPSLHENVPFVSPIFLKRSLVFPILLLFSIFLHCLNKTLYPSLLFSGTLHLVGISFPFSFAFRFSSYLSYLYGLLRQPLCPFAFIFLEMVLITASCTMLQTSVYS